MVRGTRPELSPLASNISGISKRTRRCGSERSNSRASFPPGSGAQNDLVSVGPRTKRYAPERPYLKFSTSIILRLSRSM